MKNIQTAQKYKPGAYIVSLDHLMEQEGGLLVHPIVDRVSVQFQKVQGNAHILLEIYLRCLQRHFGRLG